MVIYLITFFCFYRRFWGMVFSIALPILRVKYVQNVSRTRYNIGTECAVCGNVIHFDEMIKTQSFFESCLNVLLNLYPRFLQV